MPYKKPQPLPPTKLVQHRVGKPLVTPHMRMVKPGRSKGVDNPEFFEHDSIYDYFVPANSFAGSKTETVAGKIPTDVKNTIDMIIGHRNNPFMTISDVVRSAVVRLVSEITESCNSEGKFGNSVFELEMAILEAQGHAEASRMSKFTELSETYIRARLSEGRLKGAYEHLIKTERTIDKMKGSPDQYQMGMIWAKRIRDELFHEVEEEVVPKRPKPRLGSKR